MLAKLYDDYINLGDEDIKKLTEEEILSILTSKSKAFINLIKAVHLNERLPEYSNILVNNLRKYFLYNSL